MHKLDQDYNDLVVQSDVTKSPTELKINFLATARGAAYDHSFLVKISIAGIVDIFGTDPAYPTTNDGTYYYVTVFGRWPLESVPITQPYPNFTSITGGFNMMWYTPLADASKTFNKANCL